MAITGLRTDAFCWFLWLSTLLFLASSISSSPIRKIPRLGVVSRHQGIKETSVSPDSYFVLQDLQTYYYSQTLDHFNFQPQSYATFRQRYVLSFRHWRGAQTSAPIFAYLGAEAPLEFEIGSVGMLFDNAAKFGALAVFIEHRFYGDSIPSVSRHEAIANKTLRGYLNSAQALADYAEILLFIKQQLSAETSPIIVVGGSYGGMLAAWFRLKYPHIALGALASSAPVLYFDNLSPPNAYYSIVSKDFWDTSESCFNTIKRSWDVLDRVYSLENGLSFLSEKFNTCAKLNNVGELVRYIEQIIIAAAQYDRPPTNQLSRICNGVDNAPLGSDLLDRLYSGVVAFYETTPPCLNLSGVFSPEITEAWNWQTCSEIVMPIGAYGNDNIVPPSPFDIKETSDYCYRNYGVMPRPHWVTTHYGGQNIYDALRQFGSNIIFSNGLRDPFSGGGVLFDISDSILALNTVQGTHCMDLSGEREDDPEWLLTQRNMEVGIIGRWLVNYYQFQV